MQASGVMGRSLSRVGVNFVVIFVGIVTRGRRLAVLAHLLAGAAVCADMSCLSCGCPLVASFVGDFSCRMDESRHFVGLWDFFPLPSNVIW